MVEWKKLGEVCEIKTGRGITQKDCFKNAPYPVISGGQSPMGMYKDYNRESDNVTISRVGAYAGFVSFIKERFYLNDKCFSVIPFSNSLIPIYLFHYLKSKEDIIKSLQSEGGVPTINTRKLSKIQIPIPSKSEQERIVSILDTFTSSIANLKEQIKERRKQYEHYRDQLLKQIDKVECIKQNCVIIKGTYITKKDTTPGCIPVILGGQEPAYYIDKSNHEGKAIVISRSGASAGYVSFWNEPIFVTDGFLIEPKNETLLIEYLFHALKNKQSEIQSLKRGAGVPHITTNHINEFVIPKPSLQTQSRIVTILDQFEASIANLEAQLKEREKQYEYYRNQLLTFE